MPEKVNLVDTTGKTYAVPVEAVESYIARGWTPESASGLAARTTTEAKEDMYGGIGGQASAVIGGIARGATAGLSDVGARALGGEDLARSISDTREANPTLSAGSEIIGAVAPALLSGGTSGAAGLARLTPAGAISRLGARVGTAAEGAGAVARIGRAVAGGVVEGSLFGAGQGASEIALSKDPVSVERAASILGSNILFGGAVGGVAGGLTKGVEVGLSKAKGALDRAHQAAAARSNVADDLASLDAKGLRAAEKAELEAIESSRVAQRAEIADELRSFRRELKEQKQFLTTKDVDLPAVGEKLGAKELGKKALKANKQLDNILDNPVGLAKNPAKALDALQRQEDALARLAERTDDLKGLFAADTSGERLAALNTIGPALERNRALQAKITALGAAPASPRLASIVDAKDALALGGGPKGLGEQIVGGAVFSGVAGAISAIPIPGASAVGMYVGARAADMVASKVFGRMTKASGDAAARISAGVKKFADVAQKVTPAAPVLATKVLSQVAYAPADRTSKAAKPGKASLPASFERVAKEIRSQTIRGPDGAPMMRPESRAAMAERMSPIRAGNPLLADQIETIKARQVAFLAGKLPMVPDLPGVKDWPTSDMEMRTFARYVAAVEDPAGVVERLAAGTVTPEDAEAMREVYPEMYADIQRQIIESIDELQKLPYARRLSFSIFSDIAVDAAMDPMILGVLQASFTDEPGTEGGTVAPMPKPAFGSVKNQEATPSQSRQGVGT